MPGASPGLATLLAVPPFHFEHRQISVDWHRLCTLDVERVAREVDVAVLQEHITGITFCNLDGEQCLHCGRPVDPSLLKVFRMAQLIIEYLLHCQEVLETSLATHTQCLKAAHVELLHTQQQAAEQVVKLQLANQESRIWKKLTVTKQPVLQAGPNTRCKCHLCNKAFKNSSFLRDHLQRRHVETTKAERRKLKKVKQMECEVKEMKVKLQDMQQQLATGKLRGEQEMERARRQEEDVRNCLEKWEEERTKLHEEIDGLRQLFFTVFKASGSSAMERKLQELQAREVVESNVETLQKNDTEEQCQAPNQAELWREWERMAMQKENKTLHDIPFQDQPVVMDHVHQQMHTVSTCFGELPKKKKKTKLLSASKYEVTQKVTKLLADEELTGEEEATLGSKQRLLEALQGNPNFLKQFHPIVEEALEENLESMGVKRVAKASSPQTYRRLQAQVTLQQQQKSKKFPGFLQPWNKFIQAVIEKVKHRKKSVSASQISIISAQNPKSPGSLCGSQLMSIPDEVEPEDSVIPHPTPRSRNIHSPSKTPWDTLQTSKASSTHQGLVQPQKSDVILGGNQPTLSPMSFRAKQEPVLSPVMLGDETDSSVLDLDLLEKIPGSGTATPMPLRLLEKHLSAVAQRPPSGVTHFPPVSLTSLITRQSPTSLQFTGETSDLEISSLEDLAYPLGDREGTLLCRQPLDGATRPEVVSSCSEASPGLIFGYGNPVF